MTEPVNNVNSITTTNSVTPAKGANQNVSSSANVKMTRNLNEAKKAYDNGQTVAANLIGYTNDSDRTETTNIIQNEVGKDNVVSFLKGYEDYYKVLTDPTSPLRFEFKAEWVGGLVPDRFFEQLRSEDGFKQRHDLIRTVASNLMKNFEMNGCSKEAKQISEILKHKEFSKTDTKTLDNLAKDAIKYL